MNETMKMVQSLGLYVLTAKASGKTLDDCRAANDYHDLLRSYEVQAAGMSGMFGFNAENPLKPIDDITLTFNQFCAIAEQIFGGVTQMNALYLPYPRPAAAVAAQAAHQTNYFQNYLATKDLQGDTRTPLDVNATMARMNELLMNRPDGRIKGLVVGRVQSGKTRNYVGLALKAIDEGWNVIIVLTSCSTALADQTEERILKDFKSSGVIHGPNFLKLNFRVDQPVPEPQALQNGNYAYLGVAMKQRDHLDHIIGWFNTYPEHLPHMRVLLIDDEADNATPDSNVSKDNKLVDDAIDELIDDIEDAARDENPTYKELADWVDLIWTDGEFSDEDGRPDAGIVKALKQELEHAVASTFDDVLHNNNYRRILALEPYQVKGQTIDVPNLISAYFNKQNGRRSRSYFIRLLKGLLDVAVKRSAINHRICTIVGKSESTGVYNFGFGRFAYVAYTATPYANMFNERADQTPLYPDFIRSLHEAPQYFGLDKIFGDDIATASPKMNIVREIPTCDGEKDHPPSGEVRFILRPIQQIKDQTVHPKVVLPINGPDENLKVTCAHPQAQFEGTWDSLKEAVEWFFCSAAARRWHRLEKYIPKVQADESLTDAEKAKKINSLERRWTTMLVNISQKRTIHKKSKDVIDAYIKKMCSLEHRESFIAECNECWETMTTAFSNEGERGFNSLFNSGEASENYGPIDDYPSWEAVLPHLRYFMEGVEDVTVHSAIINSESKESRKSQDRYNQRKGTNGCKWNFENELHEDHAWIICGGNTISRGLTMIGLTTSYFDRVRGSAAVDTLTQMGRWFGFRPGYELYPRLWMTSETVKEMKNICATENFMHEAMRENFDAGYSPDDPDHYQQVYYWGRKLSGRQRQFNLRTVALGATATTNDLFVVPETLNALYESAKAFISRIGQDAYPRSATEYQYNEMPLWENVPVLKVLTFLREIPMHFPSGSRRKIQSLIRDIESSEESFWDVVIGEPVVSSQTGQPYMVDGCIKVHGGLREVGTIKSGSPNSQSVDGYERYAKARSDMSFFSMIKKEHLAQADLWVLKECRNDILATIRAEMVAKGGNLPAAYGAAFTNLGIHGHDVAHRLDAYIGYCEAHPGNEIAPCFRSCFAAGYRTRTSLEYFEKVHELAGHTRPVLQLFFITPSQRGVGTDVPIVSVSFYWPNHSAESFQIGTVFEPPPPPHPSSLQVKMKIGEILANNHFPMTSQKLKDALMTVYPNEQDSIYYNNVVSGQEVGGYKPFPGKNAYYSEEWACGEDPVERVNRELLTCVIEVLKRDDPETHAPIKHRATELVDQVMRENSRLDGIVDFNSVILNQQLLTDEVQAQYGISKICGSPVTYLAQ